MASTPGSVFPSISSSEAPPPVDTWVILSARPAFITACTEHAHRAIPEDGPRLADGLAVLSDRARSDIDDGHARGHIAHVVGHRALRAVGVDARRRKDVDRKEKTLLLLLELLHDARGLRGAIGLHERRPDLATRREEERVGHAPADRERVDLRHERLQHVDLRGDLRTADDRDERPPRFAEQTAQRAQLLLHEETGVRGEELRHALGRGVRAMRGAKGVVHVEIEAVGEPFRERGIVLLFFGMEAHVLEKHDAAGTQLRDGGPNLGAHAI